MKKKENLKNCWKKFQKVRELYFASFCNDSISKVRSPLNFKRLKCLEFIENLEKIFCDIYSEKIYFLNWNINIG